MQMPLSISDLIAESLTQERSGNIGVAIQQAREALEKARASEETGAVAAALVRVAHVRFRTGGYEEALRLAEEALSHTGSDSRTRADALLILGLCSAETDDPQAAELFYHQAIELSRQLGYWRALLRSLHNLSAGVYVPRGQFDLALAADEEAFRLATERQMEDLAWAPLSSMGWVCWVTGHRDRAHTVAEQLRQFALPGSLAEGFYFCLCADLAQDEGEPAESLALYARARSIAEAIGDPGLNVLVRLGLSRFHRRADSAPVARNWANDALDVATRAGYRHLQGMALITRGRAFREIGDLHAAETDLRAAVTTLTPLHANFDVARATLLLADLLWPIRRAEAKTVWLDAAQRILDGGYFFLLEQERSCTFPIVAATLGDTNPQLAATSSALLTQLERVPPPPLHIVTLGQFTVGQGNRTIPNAAWKQRRAGELFRLLLISHGHTLHIDQIVEALWPGKTVTATRAPFHQATSALRRALEPDLPPKFPSRYITVEEGQVTLHLPPGSSIDFETFERLVETSEYHAALALFRGAPFPDDRYADWAAIPAERLNRLLVYTLQAVAQEYLEAGHFMAALNACHRVLSIEPWQESVVQIGMNACLALNDRAGAIRLYRTMERRLRDDLGVAPQAALCDFFRSLL